MLTEYASWRWCLLVNVPIALLAAIAAFLFVHESRASGSTRYDVPGALLSTLGLVSLVYGFTKAESDGWSATVTIVLLVVAVVLLAAFVFVETKTSHPLLPLRVVPDRNRGGAFLASLLTGAGLFAMFVFLSYYLQGVLHYSALKAGLAFLPFAFGIILAAAARPAWSRDRSADPDGGRPRHRRRRLGLADPDRGAQRLLGPCRSAGDPDECWAGLAFPAFSNTALIRVRDRDAGVASALVNTTQQIGGSLGTALLNTLAATATASYIVAHGAAASRPASSTASPSPSRSVRFSSH